MAFSCLPQPTTTAEHSYKYILYDVLQSTFVSSTTTLEKDTLCWVLKSKGVKSKSDDCSQRLELFQRARVVSKEDGRVLVRYPKGSKYHVKRSNLLRVLEPGTVGLPSNNIVLVTPETPEYRRACVVHTCVGESFLEIGCDFGPTVNRVQKALTQQVGAVVLPRKVVGRDNVVVPSQDDGRVMCLGIDKSVESINIAMNRYPDCTFSLQDALTADGTVKLRNLCKEVLLHGYPSVVAVDINGNRELPAVLACLHNILNPGDDVVVGTDWQLPRLIICKSRLLYWEISQGQNGV